MAEDLIPILTRFHREIVLPDMERVIDERITASETRQNAHFDAIYARFKTIEIEYHLLLSAVREVEERLGLVERCLDRVEQKLTKQDAQAELATLKARVDALQLQIRQLEDRLGA